MDSQLIDEKKYSVYLECIQNEDIWGVIKIPKKILSEEEFRILSGVEEYLKDYHSKYYSREFKKKIKKHIDKLKPFLTDELFQKLEKDKI